MNDPLGVNKGISGMNQQDWQKRLAEIVQSKLAQNSQQGDQSMQPAQAVGQSSGAPTNKSFVNNDILNNVANGMSFSDALLKKPMDKFNALSKLFGMFGGA